MKTIVVIGDVHGRTIWEDIILAESGADLFVFLGDYVSSHTGISGSEQIRNLKNILNLKELEPSRTILLRGNHDLQHLGYSWAECSSLFQDVQVWMMSEAERFMKDTQWIYQEPGIIFSHAGVSKAWMDNSRIADVSDINNLPACEIFAFTPNLRSDYTGISETQPPTWIRPEGLYKSRIPGYTQVVGHTPVRSGIVNLNRESGEPGLWLVDALGLGEYLVIEGTEFKVRSL